MLVGRKPDGSSDGPIDARVRLVPLPSVGHHHADRGIRRVLVQVPADCSLDAGDVHWAFSGLDLVDHDTGEVLAILTPAADDAILDHYGIADGPSLRTWRSVTPIVLPQAAARRRIEPSRKVEEAKEGRERFAEQARAATSVGRAFATPASGSGRRQSDYSGNRSNRTAHGRGLRRRDEVRQRALLARRDRLRGAGARAADNWRRAVAGFGRDRAAGRTEGIDAFAVDSGLIGKQIPPRLLMQLAGQ